MVNGLDMSLCTVWQNVTRVCLFYKFLGLVINLKPLSATQSSLAITCSELCTSLWLSLKTTALTANPRASIQKLITIGAPYKETAEKTTKTTIIGSFYMNQRQKRQKATIIDTSYIGHRQKLTTTTILTSFLSLLLNAGN